MIRSLRNKFQGFTLIELMIVVAILGILAAVAVPAFLKYIRDSKTAEAEENLKSIGDGAVTYYQEEHPDATGLSVVTRVYPVGTGDCTTGMEPTGSKVDPSTGGWMAAAPWTDLRFTISKPHYYQYCYSQQASGKEFLATAQAALGGNTTKDSEFHIEGLTDTATDGPKLTAIIEDL